MLLVKGNINNMYERVNCAFVCRLSAFRFVIKYELPER